MTSYEKISKCLVCGDKRLVPYLSLGNQPLANEYRKENTPQSKYPLGLQVCGNCFHSQLTHKVSPHLMFDDYIYVSGTSDTLRQYFREFVHKVMSSWKGKKPPRILEIGCNDGTLLKMFEEQECKVVGVDPASNLCWLCKDKGLEVYCGYWEKVGAKYFVEEGHKFDIVIAVNVLPHVPNPVEFLEACKIVLDPKSKGTAVYIQSSQCDMFPNGEWDVAYHEHHSYFTASSFGTLAYAADLEIEEASKVPIHSTSFLFKLGQVSGDGHCDKFYNMLEEENKNGWHTVDKYKQWANKIKEDKQVFLNLLEPYREAGCKIVGLGASAKSSTVLNFFGVALVNGVQQVQGNLGQKSDQGNYGPCPDYFIDEAPAKQGLLTPGTNSPIYPMSKLKEEKVVVCFINTTWNFPDILDRVRLVRGDGNDVLLSYLPRVELKRL